MAKIETSICVSDWISFPLAALNGAIAFFGGCTLSGMCFTIAKITIFNSKILHWWAIIHSDVELPEGTHWQISMKKSWSAYHVSGPTKQARKPPSLTANLQRTTARKSNRLLPERSSWSVASNPSCSWFFVDAFEQAIEKENMENNWAQWKMSLWKYGVIGFDTGKLT